MNNTRTIVAEYYIYSGRSMKTIIGALKDINSVGSMEFNAKTLKINTVNSSEELVGLSNFKNPLNFYLNPNFVNPCFEFNLDDLYNVIPINVTDKHFMNITLDFENSEIIQETITAGPEECRISLKIYEENIEDNEDNKILKLYLDSHSHINEDHRFNDKFVCNVKQTVDTSVHQSANINVDLSFKTSVEYLKMRCTKAYAENVASREIGIKINKINFIMQSDSDDGLNDNLIVNCSDKKNIDNNSNCFTYNYKIMLSIIGLCEQINQRDIHVFMAKNILAMKCSYYPDDTVYIVHNIKT